MPAESFYPSPLLYCISGYWAPSTMLLPVATAPSVISHALPAWFSDSWKISTVLIAALGCECSCYGSACGCSGYFWRLCFRPSFLLLSPGCLPIPGPFLQLLLLLWRRCPWLLGPYLLASTLSPTFLVKFPDSLEDLPYSISSRSGSSSHYPFSRRVEKGLSRAFEEFMGCTMEKIGMHKDAKGIFA